MKLCDNCGAELENYASFCKICGAEAEVVEETKAEDIQTEELQTKEFQTEELQIKGPALQDWLGSLKKFIDKLKKNKKQSIIFAIVILCSILIYAILIVLSRTPQYEAPIKCVVNAVVNEDIEMLRKAYIPQMQEAIGQEISDFEQDDNFLQTKYFNNDSSVSLKEVKYKVEELTKANDYSIKNFEDLVKTSSGNSIKVENGYYVDIEITYKDMEDPIEVQVVVCNIDDVWGIISWKY